MGKKMSQKKRKIQESKGTEITLEAEDPINWDCIFTQQMVRALEYEPKTLEEKEGKERLEGFIRELARREFFAIFDQDNQNRA